MKGAYSRMSDMKSLESPAVYIPIVFVKDEEKFFEIARNAKMVVYDVEKSLDTNFRYRKITVYAIGFEKEGLPLTVGFRLSISDIIEQNVNSDYEAIIEKTHLLIDKLVKKVSTEYNGVEGHIESPNLQEIWKSFY